MNNNININKQEYIKKIKESRLLSEKAKKILIESINKNNAPYDKRKGIQLDDEISEQELKFIEQEIFNVQASILREYKLTISKNIKRLFPEKF